ncbi:LLM class flavin-dependent oxidoreductase [Paenibacillus hemerocallicola]|uniref:LLM class flavin-dependent oxidoreductase n=1 Tax=Paenibacillus hemerocallicola TaxID=1172614 RepID=A0A5C4TD39_9BACL|nr:LLM class flavin-dependent oxidoreductase [Paenibacillus hemerocallicola]TNJ66994.1 LLM class flavin-dependent oxidoreductase [Paenibacillus hemerocallicola]
MSHASPDRTRRLHLGVFLDGAGHYSSAWRHPASPTDRFFQLDYYKQLASTAERGKFDMVFFSDRYGIPDRYGDHFRATVRSLHSAHLDPFTLIAALAGVTEKVGLAATVSTSFSEPFHVARQFASLDWLSGGRTAWNIVTSTSDNEARNFGEDHIPDHDVRYERAKEYVTVANGLWDSWEADAFVFDKEAGIYANADKIRYLHHRGRHFAVRGPLDVPRSPQGRPVLVQAGSSDTGRDFAAHAAEVIFTAQPSLEGARTFYADMKTRAAAYDRSADSIKVMPGLMPIVGETEAEARDTEALLAEYADPIAGLAILSDQINYDLSVHPLDGPVPELHDVTGMQSRLKLIAKLVKSDALTLRQLGKFYGGSRLHRKVVGSPTQIADFMQDWFAAGACDGFNLMPPYLPDGLDKFVELVVPELQNRGLIRTEYEGCTLREHLGLPWPAGRPRF